MFCGICGPGRLIHCGCCQHIPCRSKAWSSRPGHVSLCIIEDWQSAVLRTHPTWDDALLVGANWVAWGVIGMTSKPGCLAAPLSALHLSIPALPPLQATAQHARHLLQLTRLFSHKVVYCRLIRGQSRLLLQEGHCHGSVRESRLTKSVVRYFYLRFGLSRRQGSEV